MDKDKIYNGNLKDEWYTPKSIVDLFGKFTLDPATTKRNAQRLRIEKYYTKETDGLSHSWERERVWLNPPFSNKEEWIEKARYEVDNNNAKIFILLPLSPETKIWKECILGRAIIHIPNKRISFLNEKFQYGNGVAFTSVIVELTKEENNTYETFNI